VLSGSLVIRPRGRLPARAFWELRERIERKYGNVTVDPLPPSPENLRDEWLDREGRALRDKSIRGETLSLDEQADLYRRAFAGGAPAEIENIRVVGHEHPFRLALNEGCAGLELRRRFFEPREGGRVLAEMQDRFFWNCQDEAEEWHRIPCWRGSESMVATGYRSMGGGRNPDAALYTLTVTVDLRRVPRDHTRVTVAFGRLLRHCLRFAPRGSNPESRDDLAHLAKISRRHFQRALRRYDRHMTDGRSAAEIAREEHATPDSVERDIKLIYVAVFRRPYVMKRRRLDAAAAGVAPYNCPQHGGDCTASCPTLRAWMSRLQSVLPSDEAGRGRSTVRLETLEASRRRRRQQD
jgi:hypothetical protein